MSAFTHESVYSAILASPPKVLLSPSKYIQGPGTLDALGHYVRSLFPRYKTIALLLTEGGKRRNGAQLSKSLSSKKVEFNFFVFEGKCTYSQVKRLTEEIRSWNPSSLLIGFGGGSLIDCAKFIAFNLSTDCVIVPSVASNDAPCSALSIMYTEEGEYCGGEVYPVSPSLVVVDTAVISKAPLRMFVSGMGDALATYYEAKTCFRNPNGRSMVNARPTLTSQGLGRLCVETLYEHGIAGAESVKQNRISEELEYCVEANTLLSGIGFESGGLASAHGIAQALTVVDSIRHQFLHGEMVAIGLLAMLTLEEDWEEYAKAVEFCCKVGLPVSLKQLEFDGNRRDDLEAVAVAALKQWFTHNEPFEVTKSSIIEALKTVDEKGGEAVNKYGNEAFTALHT